MLEGSWKLLYYLSQQFYEKNGIICIVSKHAQVENTIQILQKTRNQRILVRDGLIY